MVFEVASTIGAKLGSHRAPDPSGRAEVSGSGGEDQLLGIAHRHGRVHTSGSTVVEAIVEEVYG